ncbi:MAG: (Fe-S)-binding protein, partial [FCB group bacterium]
AQIKLNLNHAWSYHPVANAISFFIPSGSANCLYELFWWIHILFILAFANYLPFSKHLHVYTSIQNVFFAPFSIPNTLQKIDFEKEGIEKFGVVDIEDLSWKTLYDGYSCTHCGRCTSVCPANITGKILDPRAIIVEVRHRTIDIGPLLTKKKKTLAKSSLDETKFNFSENEDNLLNKKFVGEYESIEALWQCTTCGACMKECPICIEHVPPIIGMRRSLVMMESNFPAELQSAFSNMENNATPWAFPASQRADWAEGLNIKTAAESPEFEVLFWVGCAGSFDDRAIKISKAFAKLMQIAGVDFRILGTEEQCNGDPARRMGNEYLADTLVKANIETLNNYKVKKIVTICPHCFNTLKNEYPDFGGHYEVIHHTEFLQTLISQGKLKIKKNAEVMKKVAYHDSCYLGRYNNIYSAPRNTITNIPGLQLINPKRSGDKGLCCGAGGGQMFMEEKVGKRVNIERTEELLTSNPDIIALNCPFCMTMLTDGVKAKEKTDTVEVKDISEILLKYVEEG